MAPKRAMKAMKDMKAAAPKKVMKAMKAMKATPKKAMKAMKAMTLVVQVGRGKTITLEVKASDTIDNVKAKILDRGFDAEYLVVRLAGWRTLGDYGFDGCDYGWLAYFRQGTEISSAMDVVEKEEEKKKEEDAVEKEKGP